MHWLTGLACSVLVFGLAAPAMAFEPAIQATVANPATPLISGSTNLPDGTPLMVTVQAAREDATNPGHIIYPLMGESSASVHGGRFTAGPFSNHGDPYGRGSYWVTITIATLALPDTVKTVLGDGGQKLDGPDVKQAPFGPTYEIKKSFQVR